MKRVLCFVITVFLLLSFLPVEKAQAANYAQISLSQKAIDTRVSMRKNSGDCAISSVASVEAYVNNISGNSQAVYNAVRTANGGGDSVYWAKVGYKTYGLSSDCDGNTNNFLQRIYNELANGRPVIVKRNVSGKTHFSLAVAYHGSTSQLEESGFTVMDVYGSTNILIDNMTTWAKGGVVNQYAVRGSGIATITPGTTNPPSTPTEPTVPDIALPTAPTGLSATSASADNNSARITWNSVSGATSYQAQYWSPAGNEWRADGSYSSGTSYTSTGLSANSSWTFRVRAVNSAGASDWSTVTYTKPAAPQQPTVSTPPAPTGLSASSASSDNNSARITWNSVSGATSYQAQYWSPAGNEWRTDGSYSSGTSYTSTGLSANSSWTFRVRAVNSAGASDWSTVTYTKPAAPQQPTVYAPSAPTGLSASSASSDNNTARITWNSVSGATSYQAQYWSPAGNEWRTDGSYTSGTTYISTGLSANSSWTFRIRAVNSAGASDWSQVTYYKPAVYTPPPVSNDYSLDGYPAYRIERNMTVNVGVGSTLRFCDAPKQNNTRLGAISNGATVYVYGSTINQYPNDSGTYINWAKISYNGQTGWVRYSYLN